MIIMVYISLFMFLFILAFAKGGVNYKIGLLAILITTCLRAQNIGIDTAGGYSSYFRWINNGSDLSSWLEPGWIVVNKVAIWLGWGYQGVLAIVGLLTIIPVSYVIKRTCINKRLSLAVYYGMCYVFISYNLMRQMIAVSFALLAMYFYINKNLKYAIFWLIAGFLFHESIIFIIPVALFLKLDVKYSKVVVLVFISFLCGILLSNQFFFIVSGQYAKYLMRPSGFRSSLLKPILFSFLFDIFFLFFIQFRYEKLRRNPYFLISLLSVLVMNLTMRMAEGTRIVLYFSQAQMICFPNHLKEIRSYKNKIILTLIYIAYLATNFMRILLGLWETLNPYNFFWEYLTI